MNAIVFLISVALLATIISFFSGSISMAIGGKYDDSHSEGFMESSLIFQGLTLLLIIIAVFVW